MKIVYLVQQTFKSGGVERVLASKANWLSLHNNDVVIITTEQKGCKSFFDFNQSIKHIDLGINYWDNTRRSTVKKIPYFFVNQIRHRRRLRKVLSEIKPDVVVSMFGHDMSHLPHIKDGSVKVLEFHFTHQRILNMFRPGFLRLWDYWNYRQMRRTIDKFQKFVVLSDADRCAWGKEKNTMVIPNPLSFNPRTKASLDSNRAIAVGRLVEEKGFDRLIEVWKKIQSKYPQWSLEIIGDGPLRDDIQRLINKNGLQATVTLLPATPQIQEKYIDASLLLMTSRHEGLGMVLIEGQAYGLPCVSFDVPYGPASIITNDENGYLIPDGDIDTYASKVENLIKDVHKRKVMGEKARLNSQRYTMDKIMSEWIELFKELTGKGIC